MKYVSVFKTSFCQVDVHTNDVFLHTLVRNVMDFSDKAGSQEPCLHVRFYFDNAAISASGSHQEKFLRSKYHKDKDNLIYNFFQHNATMVVKPAKAQVQVTIFIMMKIERDVTPQYLLETALFYLVSAGIVLYSCSVNPV